MRDRLMLRMDALYPGYGLAGHKGYPTKAHFKALGEFEILTEQEWGNFLDLKEHFSVYDRYQKRTFRMLSLEYLKACPLPEAKQALSMEFVAGKN